MRKNGAFVAKIAKTRLTKSFVAIFALSERLPPRLPRVMRCIGNYTPVLNLIYILMLWRTE